MSRVTPLAIGPSTGAVTAAPLLARGRVVHLAAPPPLIPPPTFLPLAANVDLWTTTAERECDAAAAERWNPATATATRRDATLHLEDVASFGRERVVTELYFPLFVRHSFAVGRAERALNEAAFRRLLHDETLVACAREGERVVAAALLCPSRWAPTAHLSRADWAHDPASYDQVVLVTIDPATESRHAFAFAVRQMLASIGVARVRRRSLGWVPLAHTPALLDDWASADALTWESRAGDLVAWPDRDTAPALAFVPTERALVVHAVGSVPPRTRDALARALAAHDWPCSLGGTS